MIIITCHIRSGSWFHPIKQDNIAFIFFYMVQHPSCKQWSLTSCSPMATKIIDLWAEQTNPTRHKITRLPLCSIHPRTDHTVFLFVEFCCSRKVSQAALFPAWLAGDPCCGALDPFFNAFASRVEPSDFMSLS